LPFFPRWEYPGTRGSARKIPAIKPQIDQGKARIATFSSV
jgi:hypothetical protein